MTDILKNIIYICVYVSTSDIFTGYIKTSCISMKGKKNLVEVHLLRLVIRMFLLKILLCVK